MHATSDTIEKPTAPRPAVLDFCGRRELNWDEIEMAIQQLSAEARAVELLGREAVDVIHGEKMVDVFGLVAEGMQKHLQSLKSLLGLAQEVHQ